VPAFVFLKRDHTGVTNNEAANTLAIVDRVEGANAAHLTRLVEQYSQQAQLTDGLQVVQQAPSAAKETLQQRLQRLTTMAPVVLFMKGTPLEPKCGFSRQIVDLLAKQRVAYTAFDILTDEEVRQGLKEYADWPTYPQLWIGGELAGGLDIAKELAESGELKKLLPAAPADEQMAPLNERLNRLINQSKLVIFIKGTIHIYVGIVKHLFPLLFTKERRKSRAVVSPDNYWIC
jgi:Grx4 family monothiol glutaredoxin